MHPQLRSLLRSLPVLKQLRWWQRFSWRADYLKSNQELIARTLCGQPDQRLPDNPTFGSTSLLCREEHFRTPNYHRWCAELHEPPSFRRKQWEYVYILSALERCGMLMAGTRALGFGVGRELWPANFASRGIQVTATDQSVTQGMRDGWINYQQHADGLIVLRQPHIVANATLDKLVQFQTADMNNIPSNLTNFDFVWSACALEHLGSLEHSLHFIEQSLACLRPGGFAVHTLEFNGGSNDETITHGPTILMRKKDLEALSERLSRQGHELAIIDVEPGTGFVDQWVDVPPYRADPWPRLLLERHIAVSAGILIRRSQ